MKYTAEQIIPQEYIGTYGKSVIDHIHNVLNKNLADAIIENSEQDVVIHFSDFYEQPTEVISNSIWMRRNVTIKPLVRCKDCKHYSLAMLKCCFPLDDKHTFDEYVPPIWQPNDYCSYGERREKWN